MEWKNQLQNLKENIIVQTHFDVNGDFSHNNIQLTESSVINYDDLTVQFNDDYELSKAIEHVTMQNYSFDYVDERTLQLYIKYDFDNLISHIHNLKYIERDYNGQNFHESINKRKLGEALYKINKLAKSRSSMSEILYEIKEKILNKFGRDTGEYHKVHNYLPVYSKVYKLGNDVFHGKPEDYSDKIGQEIEKRLKQQYPELEQFDAYDNKKKILKQLQKKYKDRISDIFFLIYTDEISLTLERGPKSEYKRIENINTFSKPLQNEMYNHINNVKRKQDVEAKIHKEVMEEWFGENKYVQPPTTSVREPFYEEDYEILTSALNKINFFNSQIENTLKRLVGFKERNYIEKLTTLTESDKFDKIRKAIRNKKLITFLYSGDYTQSTGVRVVEPYVLGTTLAGNKVIRAYQTSGSTDNPGDMPGWRMFLTKNISNIDVSETGFSGKRPGYNAQGDKGMINIELHSGKTRIGRQLD